MRRFKTENSSFLYKSIIFLIAINYSIYDSIITNNNNNQRTNINNSEIR